MPFFVYGRDAKTGEVAKRFYSEAATQADASRHAEAHGLEVTSVVPCRDADRPVDPVVAAALTRARASTEPKPEPGEMTQFRLTLEKFTPTAWVSHALVGANVLVFVAMVASGVSFDRPTTADLLRWGADFGPMTMAGQWWRLLTSTFVHIGFIHLIYNMLAFAYVGATVERLVGNVGFLVLYLVAGIGGSLWSMVWNPMLVNAGASGAIFGVYGGLLALLLQQGSSIPAHVASRLQRFVGIFIVYNLVNSLRPDISLSAHFGGMVIGFICGFILAQPLGRDTLDARPGHNLIAVGFGIALTLVGIFALQSRFAGIVELQQALSRFDLLDLQDAKRFKDARNKAPHYGSYDADFAAMIERDLLPDWRSIRASLAATKPVPHTLQNDVTTIVDYMRLREEGWVMLVESVRENNPAKVEDAKKRLDRADSIHATIWRAPRAHVLPKMSG
jgi:rhomboid protease GluP